jgi:hypothetical protein
MLRIHLVYMYNLSAGARRRVLRVHADYHARPPDLAEAIYHRV